TRLPDGGDAGDARVLRGDMRAGAGRAFHAVDVDRVRPRLDGHAHIVIDARCAELQLDWDLAVGRLADLVDLEGESVLPQPVRMAGRRALIDARRKRAHLRHLVSHLLAHEVSAEADLAPLADEELAGIGQPQMVRVEAIAGLDVLIEPLRGIAALVRDHAALARAGRSARHGGAAGKRDLRLERERPETHAGDVDRNIQHQRALRLRPDDRLGETFLAIALDDEARQRAW